MSQEFFDLLSIAGLYLGGCALLRWAIWLLLDDLEDDGDTEGMDEDTDWSNP